jgi:azurin/sugar phosphate isomerase/epimerase
MHTHLTPTLCATLLALLSFAAPLNPAVAAEPRADIFARENLVAWCIVPFDTKKRGPEERAQMLDRLGIKRLAYDWRDEHVKTWDEELDTLKKHGIELTAFWAAGELNDSTRSILDLLKRHGVQTQLWSMLAVSANTPVKDAAEQQQRVEEAAAKLRPLAQEAAKIGCRVAIYNHGGWAGEPENQLAVIGRLRRDGLANVGIVYNLHHGHEHLARFAELLEKMQPHLLALNLNGMTRLGERPKILPLGQGELDLQLLKTIRASGWKGPVGILNHVAELDAEERLRDNLDGLDWLRAQLDGAPPGPKPTPRTWPLPPAPAKPAAALAAPALPNAKPAPANTSPMSQPAAFAPERTPLQPELWPHWQAPVNRDRVFDFYAKEAIHFGTMRPPPTLLPEFPGLDGGKFGHWGNQNEMTWRDGRWNSTDLGTLMSGVFRGGDAPVAKAVCVRLGASAELAACFEPEALDFRVVWRGGFVGFGDQRHGFLSGLEMRGEIVEKPAGPATQPAGGTYRGFYRHGARVIFSYAIDGVEMLDAAWAEDGRFVRKRATAATHPLRELTHGGPAQWPQILETRGDLGTGSPYAIDTLTLPIENPWKTLFFIGDHDFFANGDIALCTFTGEVWRVSGVDDSLARLRWKRVATGLHQPLGLVIVEDKICVLGRDQITRLHDLNGDGEADFYECLANGYTTSANGHDYIAGLQRDVQGRFYFASSKQGVCRIAPGGRTEVLATGFRNPDGLGLGADGTVTTSVQEGEWTPASAIVQITPGGYYGAPKAGITTLLPLAFLPRGLDNSSGGQTFIESDRWGLPRGQMLHFSSGAGTHFLVLRETIDGQPQGTVVPLPGDFLSGVHRGRFSPRDGQLYVSGMNGWGSYTVADGCLQRVRFTGGSVQYPIAVQTRDNGVLLTFSEPLDRAVAGDAARHFAQCWNYRYSSAYGSPEFSLKYPQTAGHDLLEIASAHVLADGRTLFLEIPQLQPANQIHLRVASGSNRTQDLFITAHKLGAPFTEFPGFRAVAKDHVAHVHPGPVASAVPNPWTKGEPGRAIRIEAANGLQFSAKELHAKAGERLSLTFTNPDVMPHNWALLAPGSLPRIGELANKLVGDPAGAERQYVPETSDVLAYTDIVAPGGTFTIHFTAPAKPGDYPYLCTFPGHWQIMNGVMKVE